jgi:two-component system, sensor histidine kinase and response regulator
MLNLEACIQAIPSPVVVTKTNGEILFYNQLFMDLIPESAGNIQEKKIHESVFSIDHEIDLSDLFGTITDEVREIVLIDHHKNPQRKMMFKVKLASDSNFDDLLAVWQLEQCSNIPESTKGRGVFNNIDQPLLILSQKFTILEINNACSVMLGYKNSELAGKGIGTILIDEAGQFLSEIDFGSHEKSFQLTVKRSDGVELLVRLNINFGKYFGQPAWVVSLKDTKEELKLQEELLKEKQYFEYLLESIPFGTVVLNEDDVILDCNHAFCSMFGYEKQQLSGQPVNDMIVPKTMKDQGLDLTKAVSQGDDIYKETKRMRSDGSLIDVAITGRPIVLPDGKFRVFGIYQDITERLLLRQSLVDEKAYFESLYENVPFAIILLDNHEKIVDCNSIFVQMFGYSKEELLEFEKIDLIFPENLIQEGSALRACVLSGENVYKETIRKRKDGSLLHVAITAKPVKKQNGEVLIFGIYQDITSKKEAETNLMERERELSAIVEYLPGMVYRCLDDKDYTMLFVSGGSLQVTGYDPRVFLSNAIKFNDIIFDEYQEYLWDKWQKVIKDGTVFNAEYRIIAADGSEKWVWERGRAVSDNQGKLLFLEGYIEDVTDRKLMQDALRNERDLLQALMDNIPDTIYFKDKQSRFIRINKAQSKVLGVENAKDVVGKSDYDFFDEAHANIAYDDEQRLMATGIPVINKEEHILTANGWKWFTASKVPLYDENGNVYGLVGASRDITEFKKLEQLLRQSENDLQKINAEKDKLFSVIAHDLRSPFNSFLLLTEMLADEYMDFTEEEMTKLVKSMYKTAVSVSDLLENLLEWSKIQRGLASFQPVNLKLSDIIQKNLDYFHTHLVNKEIDLELRMDENLMVYADPSMVSSVLRNLVSNAIKFTRHQGSITIDVSKPSVDMVLIRISDTGVGMSESMISKLFSVETKGRKGTDDEPSSGLGLILVKEFVQKMNGKVHLESKQDEGTSFFVELPSAKL